jgi:cardiolipin synthase
VDWRKLLKAVPTVLAVINIIIRIAAVVRIPRDRRPTSAMAWLVTVFALPIPGALLFLLFGSTKLPQDRRDKQSEINSYIWNRSSS